MSNLLLPSGTHTHQVSDVRNFRATNGTPTSANDASQGFEVNSIWTNTSTDISYICVDNSIGSAIWQQFSPSGGTATVLINETRFVDELYGSLAGVQNDMTSAWNDIANAYNSSPVPNIIYVQPGQYTMLSTLNLRGGVELYFAQGARIYCNGEFPMFGHLAAFPLRTSITGFGYFEQVYTAPILEVRYEANLVFQANRIGSSFSNNLFLLRNDGSNTINVNIEIERIDNDLDDNRSVLRVQSGAAAAGPIQVQLDAQQIRSGILASVEAGATAPEDPSGAVRISAQSIETSAPAAGDTSAVSAVVRNDSSAFAVHVDCETLSSASDTQAFQIVSSTASDALIAITAQTLQCRALAWLSAPLLSASKPQVRLDVQRIVLSSGASTTTRNIYTDVANIAMDFQSLENNGTYSAVYRDTEALNGSRVDLSGNQWRNTARLFRTTALSRLNATIADIVTSGQMIDNDNGVVVVRGDTITSTAPPSGTQSVSSYGGTAASLTLDVATLLSLRAINTGIIAADTGSIVLNIAEYRFGGNPSTALVVNTGVVASLTIGRAFLTGLALQSTFLQTDSSNIVADFGIINQDGTPDATAIDVRSGRLQASIGRIETNASGGSGLLLQNDAQFVGSIDIIEFTDSGSVSAAITTSGTASGDLTCQTITTGAGIAVSHASSGSLRLSFQSIEAANAATTILCTGVGSAYISGKSVSGSGITQHLSGQLWLDIDDYTLATASAGIAIQIGNAATADITIGNLDYSSPAANIAGIYTVGNTKLNIAAMTIGTAGNATALSVAGGQTTGNINRISIDQSTNGQVLLVDGSGTSFVGVINEFEIVPAGSGISGLVCRSAGSARVLCERIRMGAGMAIVQSDADTSMNVQFQSITTQNAAAAAIWCDGTGSGVFTGQSIEMASGSTSVVRVATTTAAPPITVSVDTIDVGTLNACFDIDLASGSQFFGKYTSARSTGTFTGAQPAFIKLRGEAANAIFDITGTNTVMSDSPTCPIVRHSADGTSIIRLGTAINTSPDLGTVGVHTLQNANCTVYFEELRTFSYTLLDQSINNVWFEGKFANSTIGPVVYIQPPSSVATTRLTVGGLLRSTNAIVPTTIQFGNTEVRQLRLLTSTLICYAIGLGQCISTTGGVGQTAIIQASIANFPVDPLVTVIGGALVVDGAVSF